MNALHAYARVLANGPLARLLSAEFLSSVADWMYAVALLVIVYQTKPDLVLLGIVGGGRILPTIFFAVPAGRAAERFGRRPILALSAAGRAACLLGLAAVSSGGANLVAVIGLTIAATSFSVFFYPAVAGTLPVLLRDESEFGPANRTWSTLDNMAFIVGPAIAGLLIVAIGVAISFLVAAAAFALVTILVLSIPTPRSTRSAGRPIPIADRPDGRETAIVAPAGVPAPPLGPIAGVSVIDVTGYFINGAMSVVTVVLATDVYHAGEAATGYLNAAIGVGGLLGALMAGALVLRPRLGMPLFAGAAMAGVGTMFVAATDSLTAAVFLFALGSAGSVLLQTVRTTMLGRVVTDDPGGRISGYLLAIAMFSYAVGSFATPVLVGLVGSMPVFAVAGALVLVTGGLSRVLVGSSANREPGPLEPFLLRLRRLSIFGGLPPARLETALDRFVAVPMRLGDIVIRQGDPADRFYVVVEGRLLVTRHETSTAPEHILRKLGPWDVFGEIGLLTAAPRTATVIAETDGLLLALDGQTFLDVVIAGPEVASRFLELYDVSGVRETIQEPASPAVA
ncbi:MAG TPA: MFS transporter [Candidatus Limnocylindrales bacterium]